MQTTTTFRTLAATLLIAASLGAQKNKPLPAQPTPPPLAQKSAQVPDIYPMPPTSYYLKHFGIGVMANICECLAVDIVTRAIGCSDPITKEIPNSARWAHLGVVMYLNYMLPQWIDRYVIGNTTTYTTKENIIRLLSTCQLGNYYVQLQKHRAS